jgi:hypothetical protein
MTYAQQNNPADRLQLRLIFALYVIKRNILILCPYCGYDLKVMPQRKKKCPSCSRPIYVKSTPENRTKRIMTEVQAIDAENQWSLLLQRHFDVK